MHLEQIGQFVRRIKPLENNIQSKGGAFLVRDIATAATETNKPEKIF